MKGKLIYTKSALPLILDAFGLNADKNGRIMKAGEQICDPEGDLLTVENFGGIKKQDDGMIFLKNDLLTTIKLVDGEY